MRNENDELRRLRSRVERLLGEVTALERQYGFLQERTFKVDVGAGEGTSLGRRVFGSEKGRLAARRLREAGVLDERMQPVGLSGAERGMLAHLLAERLEVAHVWKVFGELWGRNPDTLRASYNHGLDTRKIFDFIGRVKPLIR